MKCILILGNLLKRCPNIINIKFVYFLKLFLTFTISIFCEFYLRSLISSIINICVIFILVNS